MHNGRGYASIRSASKAAATNTIAVAEARLTHLVADGLARRTRCAPNPTMR